MGNGNQVQLSRGFLGTGRHRRLADLGKWAVPLCSRTGPSPSGCTREARPRAARVRDDLLPRASVRRCAGAVLTVARKVREGKEPGRPSRRPAGTDGVSMCCPAGRQERGL